MTLLRHEADPRNAARLDAKANGIRRHMGIDAPTDAFEAKKIGARHERVTMAVQGFIVNGRRIYHVFRMCGKQATWAAGPFWGPGIMGRDEALACARDLQLGRVSVARPGLRGVFKARGRILVPSGEIDKPGDPSPKLTVHGDGGMVVG